MIVAADNFHPQVMAMPRVKIVCGMDYTQRPYPQWQFGLLWDANPWPRPGEFIYRRQLIFRVLIDTGFWR